jgi:micrococcal nuclease
VTTRPRFVHSPTRCLLFAVVAIGEAAISNAEVDASCTSNFERSHARVTAITKNGVLALADGRTAHLESVLLPAGPLDHAPDLPAGLAISELGKLVSGREVVLATAAPVQDRYGRLRAQIFVEDGPREFWLQLALLQRGLARVSIAPDRRECARDLYTAEGDARARKIGIWAERAYGVRTPAQAADAIGTFQIVQGRVVSATRRGGRVYLDFPVDTANKFAATISPGDLKAFRQTGVDPLSYAGHTLRVRGWIERHIRAEIEIAIPEDIEMIEDAKPPV